VADDSRSVLIADDDRESRAALASLVARTGLATLEAATGAEAVALARTERPALILLEVSLPDAGGYEVCRELRDEFGDGVAIVFVSATKTEALDRAAGLMIGADDYVVKPFEAPVLISRVRAAFRRIQRSAA
jgi:two-component system, OmpR family, response regulator